MSISDGAAQRLWHFEALDARPVRRWLGSRGGDIQVTDGEANAASESFWDTEDWRIHRAGYTLRVRPGGGGLEALLAPREATSNGLDTYTQALADASAEELAADRGEVGTRVHAIAGNRPLARRFELSTSRTVHGLRRGEASVATVALSELTLPVEGSDPPVRLARAAIATVDAGDDLLEQLVTDCGLRPATSSTYDTCLMVLGLTPPAPVDLGPTRFGLEATAGEAAFAVLRQQFGIALAHESGTRLGEDIEELHDMRVAIRRMRAAMRLFAEYLPARTPRLRSELAWMARALGEVRDLDVQLVQIEEWRSSLREVDRDALDALRDRLTQRRIRARRQMLRALDSRRWERLVGATTRVLQHGPLKTSAAARLPILAVAPGLIEEHYRRVVRAGKKIHRGSPPERYHRMRIRCKALRYTLEFHSQLYAAPARRLIRALVGLQDLLGDHQDADVASIRLHDMIDTARGLPAKTMFVIGVLSERYAHTAAKLRRGFSPLFAELRGRRWARLHRAMESRIPAEASRQPVAPRAPRDAADS